MALERRFTDGRSFVWIRKVLSPEQMQKVHEIGDPGLLFGPREMRLYPNGTLAAHVLGGTSFGAEGVHSAEVIGVAGIEKALDTRLRDPAQGGKALTLSIDLSGDVRVVALAAHAAAGRAMQAGGAAELAGEGVGFDVQREAGAVGGGGRHGAGTTRCQTSASTTPCACCTNTRVASGGSLHGWVRGA